MPELNLPALSALLQVILVDVTLAGDNAVVVGLAVAGLPHGHRRWAIFLGIGAATLLRIALGAVALQLLEIIGLLLAGGVLLLWVCWRMFRELRRPPATATLKPPAKSLFEAMAQIVLADLSMSLDNVLAVAGAAQDHLWVLVTGLAFSVVLMGTLATLIAGLLERARWLAWVGLLIVLYIALHMVWEGGGEVLGALAPAG